MEHHAALALFSKWFDAAERAELNDPNAMFLATVDQEGLPNIRVVLMKDCNAQGITFYTNLESAKGVELSADPRATLCFNWKALDRYVVIQGAVEPVSDDDADAYFQSRARASRLGAWASQQSRPLESKTVLLKRVARYALKFVAGTIPRPPHWSGYLLRPSKMEFWRGGKLLALP